MKVLAILLAFTLSAVQFSSAAPAPSKEVASTNNQVASIESAAEGSRNQHRTRPVRPAPYRGGPNCPGADDAGGAYAGVNCATNPGNKCSEAGAEARRKADAAKNRLEALRRASAIARADPHYVYQPVSPYHAITGAEKAFKSLDAKAKALGC